MMATRRAFLAHSGAIVIGFTLLGGKTGRALAETSGHVASHADEADQAIRLGQTTTGATQLDSWLSIDRNGDVTIFSGKVELGTGVRTALGQIAAEELDLPFERVALFRETPPGRPTRAIPLAARPFRQAVSMCARRQRPHVRCSSTLLRRDSRFQAISLSWRTASFRPLPTRRGP